MQLRIILTTLLTIGASASESTQEQTGASDRRSRFMTFGEVDLAVYAPAWAAGEALRAIGETLTTGDRTQARVMLDKLLAEWSGEVILTQEALKAATQSVERKRSKTRLPYTRALVDPWARIPPAWETLSTWYNSLPAAGRDDIASLRPFERTRSLIDSDPEYWFPPLSGAAAQRRALSLSAGQVATAWRLDRAPTLSDRATLERWLRSERRAPTHAAIESFPDRRHERLNPEPVTELYLLSRHPLELASNPDRYDPTQPTAPEHPTRRSPLGAIFPLVEPDHVVIATGSEAFSVSTSRPPRVEWTIDAQSFGPKRSQPALLLPPVFATATDRYRAFLFRTNRDEVDNHPMKQILTRQRGGKEIAFHRLVVFDAESTPPKVHMDLSEHIPETDSVCGRPVIDGDRLFVPVFRGLRRVEIDVVAFDLKRRSKLWTRHLAGRSTRWISNRDLRGVLPEVELVLYGGELLVGCSFGMLSRLDTRNGHLRGVQFFPLFNEFENRVMHANTSLARFFGLPFPSLSSPRPRYPGPGLVIERPQGPLWVTLPPGSLFLLAIDLRTWTVAWKVPVEAQTSLLGMVDGAVAILDTGIDAGSNLMSYRTIGLDGRHARFADLELSVAVSVVKNEIVDPEGPLLVGMPRLFGRQLWVPSLTALEIFDVGALADHETRRTADRVIPWPTGATGGTPYPIPGGKMVTVGRGDPGLGRLGFLEIFTTE